MRAKLEDDGRRYALRPPRLTDYAGWRDIRLAHADLLAPAFGTSQRGWEQDCAPGQWIEWCTMLRRSTRNLSALAAVAVEHTDRGERVIGELGVCGVDPVTRSGEFYAWLVAGNPRVLPWGVSTMVLHAFAGPMALRRVLAPVAVVNPGPLRTIKRTGWTHRAVRRVLREYDEQPADHDIWSLENDPATRRALAGLT